MSATENRQNEEIAGRLERLGILRDTYQVEPLSRVQKFIAQRLTEASRDVPSFPLEAEIRIDELLARRARLASAGEKLSVNDFLIKAAALALRAVPQVNSSFTPDGIIRHQVVDVAVAVATDTALITPIVRGADKLGIAEISAAMRDFVARANAGRLKPDEYTGGTFAISNLGMFGITRFASIINPPHGAILSIGAAQERVVSQEGRIAVNKMISAVLTCDHRVIDGATGARWLQAFREQVERPDALFGASA